jgi:hypothetical protein
VLFLTVIPGRAEGAIPESITPTARWYGETGVMDSGTRCARPE